MQTFITKSSSMGCKMTMALASASGVSSHMHPHRRGHEPPRPKKISTFSGIGHGFYFWNFRTNLSNPQWAYMLALERELVSMTEHINYCTHHLQGLTSLRNTRMLSLNQWYCPKPSLRNRCVNPSSSVYPIPSITEVTYVPEWQFTWSFPPCPKTAQLKMRPRQLCRWRFCKKMPSYRLGMCSPTSRNNTQSATGSESGCVRSIHWT
mmetsp:Transcript_39602/g.83244  ORF Transcript_39602/g.83244 Transcript_39602/m.83244 type:complete len:207 (+) Transcript_39602:257-877(+)